MRRRIAATLALAVALTTAGCGQDKPAEQESEKQEEKRVGKFHAITGDDPAGRPQEYETNRGDLA